MSYGQNLPWGLQPTRSLGSSTWNSQTSPYLIKSGYANNIFRGDPVVVSGDTDAGGAQGGYIISLYDVNGHTYTTAATVGVFDGCAYVTPTATNPIDPASPGRQYWPSGTNTLNNVPAVAYIVDDPNTIYNVQTTFAGNTGATQTNVGAGVDFVFDQTAGQVNGNTNTGVSKLSVSNPTRGTADVNGIIVGLVPTPPNQTFTNTASYQFNNVEILIQNHQYAQRAATRA